MDWNVICRVGANDRFFPTIDARIPRLLLALDESGNSPQIGNYVLPEIVRNGLTVDDTAIDLLNLAMSVYAADLRIERSFSNDGWSRNVQIHLPVVETSLWQKAQPIITKMLAFLTGDQWTLTLRQRERFDQLSPKNPAKTCPSVVTLFSGGLDSFVGAIDLLESKEGVIALVGQYGKGSTNPSQVNSHRVLSENYLNRTRRFGFYVQPTKPGTRAAENTMRSRSILFLALGTAVATACGDGTPLYVPENGLISLNVPLTNSRMGSLSTRTTHPYFLSLYGETLDALHIRVPVILPYKFRTKGEMLKETKNPRVLETGLPQTLSCARPDAGRFQKRPPGSHCGYCVPCIIRLASMKAAGFDHKKAAYFDVTGEQAAPETAKRSDRRAFDLAIERISSLSRLGLAGEVLQSGPLPPADIIEYASVYKRGLDEVADFLHKRKSKN